MDDNVECLNCGWIGTSDQLIPTSDEPDVYDHCPDCISLDIEYEEED